MVETYSWFPRIRISNAFNKYVLNRNQYGLETEVAFIFSHKKNERGRPGNSKVPFNKQYNKKMLSKIILYSGGQVKWANIECIILCIVCMCVCVYIYVYYAG